jgi:hypothetical protein
MSSSKEQLIEVLNKEIVQYMKNANDFLNYFIAVMTKDYSYPIMDIIIPTNQFTRWIKNIIRNRDLKLDIVMINDNSFGISTIITIQLIQRFYLAMNIMYQCQQCSSKLLQSNENIFVDMEKNKTSLSSNTANLAIASAQLLLTPIIIRTFSADPKYKATITHSFITDANKECIIAKGIVCKCVGSRFNRTNKCCGKMRCTICYNTNKYPDDIEFFTRCYRKKCHANICGDCAEDPPLKCIECDKTYCWGCIDWTHCDSCPSCDIGSSMCPSCVNKGCTFTCCDWMDHGGY